MHRLDGLTAEEEKSIVTVKHIRYGMWPNIHTGTARIGGTFVAIRDRRGLSPF